MPSLTISSLKNNQIIQCQFQGISNNFTKKREDGSIINLVKFRVIYKNEILICVAFNALANKIIENNLQSGNFIKLEGSINQKNNEFYVKYFLPIKNKQESIKNNFENYDKYKEKKDFIKIVQKFGDKNILSWRKKIDYIQVSGVWKSKLDYLIEQIGEEKVALKLKNILRSKSLDLYRQTIDKLLQDII